MEPGGVTPHLPVPPLPRSGSSPLYFARLEQSLLILWSNPAVQCSSDQIIRYFSTSRGHCVLPYAHFPAVLWRHQGCLPGIGNFVVTIVPRLGRVVMKISVALSPAAVCQGHLSLFTCSVHSSTNPARPASFWAWTGWGRDLEGLCRCGKTFSCSQHTAVQRSPGFFSTLWGPPSLWDFVPYGSVILIPLLFPTLMIAGKWGAVRLNTSPGRPSLTGRLYRFSSAFLSVHKACWLRTWLFLFFFHCWLILAFCIAVGKLHPKNALC